MTDHDQARAARLRIGRRAAVLLPMAGALSGCDWLGDLFYTTKTPLPGKRIAVLTTQHGLEVEPGAAVAVSVPQAAENAEWPVPGGSPAHEMGHLALPASVREVWSSGIGAGGGYRRKITSQPVIAGGRVFTMDSGGEVSAFDVGNGGRIWRFDTQADDDRSGNLGGGVSVDAGVVYAATGRGEIIALNPADGAVKWRSPLGAAARAAGTIADGRVYVPTIDDQVLAFALADGTRLWTYQATNATTAVLGLPSPAYADGILVAGFGTGDLVALRAQSGAVAWTDTLAGSAARNSVADLATIRGLPVIVNGQVYATSVGGITLALDLRSGRRLWDRDAGSSESLCVAGDWIFMVSNDQQVAALARVDGNVAWVTELPRWENEEKERDPILWRGPVLAGDRLILAGSNSQMASVSPIDGRILGMQDLGEKPAVAPVVAGNTLFLVTDDGSLVAFR
jgi:outer membrane protein assembly factor BamB